MNTSKFELPCSWHHLWTWAPHDVVGRYIPWPNLIAGMQWKYFPAASQKEKGSTSPNQRVIEIWWINKLPLLLNFFAIQSTQLVSECVECLVFPSSCLLYIYSSPALPQHSPNNIGSTDHQFLILEILQTICPSNQQMQDSSKNHHSTCLLSTYHLEHSISQKQLFPTNKHSATQQPPPEAPLHQCICLL
jgi:hypothetical protein